MRYKLLFLLFLFFLFCPDVMAINGNISVKEVTSWDTDESKPQDMNDNALISNGIRNHTVSVENVNIDGSIGEGFGKNGKIYAKGGVIYLASETGGELDYKNVLSTYSKPSGPLATLRYEKVAQDAEETDYDAIIKINALHFEPFGDEANWNDKKGQRKYYYKIATYSENGFWLVVHKAIHQNGKLVDAIDTDLKNKYTTGFGVNYDISFSFVKSGTNELYTGAIFYPWDISDLDQNDKRIDKTINLNEAYNSLYTEGITYVDGFDNRFFIHNAFANPFKDVDRKKNVTYPSYGLFATLKSEITTVDGMNSIRFWAQYPTGTRDSKGNLNPGERDATYSKVLAYQNKATARIIWHGSGFVETKIFGAQTVVKGKTDANKCGGEFKTKNIINGVDEREDLDCGGESTVTSGSTNGEIKDTPFGNINGNIYNSCVDQTINISDVKYYIRRNNTCSAIDKLEIPIVITEDITADSRIPIPPKLNGVLFDKVFPGKGFVWSNNEVFYVTNKVNFVYQYYLNDLPYLHVTYTKRTDNGTSSDKVWGNIIYKDSSCGSVLSKVEVDELVQKNLSNKIKNLDFTDKIKSIDSNDIKNENASLFLNNNNVSSGNGGIGTYQTYASLKTAYIRISDSFVEYSNDEKDENKYIKQNGDDRGWNAHYIPLKYEKDKVYVYMKDANLSIIGQTTSYNVTCDVDVGEGYYKNGKLNYTYRSIDVNEPFPTYVPDNWSKWYADSNNKFRISNSYQYTPNYIITLNSKTLAAVGRYNEKTSYLSWNGISTDGTSHFIDSLNGAVEMPNTSNSYCNIGIFKKECDQYGGG